MPKFYVNNINKPVLMSFTKVFRTGFCLNLSMAFLRIHSHLHVVTFQE